MYNLCDDVMYYIEMSFVEPRCNILNHVYVWAFVSYLNSHLGYSAGEFQALQLIVLAVFGAVD